MKFLPEIKKKTLEIKILMKIFCKNVQGRANRLPQEHTKNP